jgi:hypothetical protein
MQPKRLKTISFVLTFAFLMMAVPAHAADDYYHIYSSITGFTCGANYLEPQGTVERNYPQGAMFHAVSTINGIEISNSIWIAPQADMYSGPSFSGKLFAKPVALPYSYAESVELYVDGTLSSYYQLSFTCETEGFHAASDATLSFSKTPDASEEVGLPGPALPTVRNLVVAKDNILVFSLADGEPTGEVITPCQTVIIIETSADSNFGKVFMLDGWISLKDTIDVDENYGQPDGQPILPQCEGK